MDSRQDFYLGKDSMYIRAVYLDGSSGFDPSKTGTIFMYPYVNFEINPAFYPLKLRKLHNVHFEGSSTSSLPSQPLTSEMQSLQPLYVTVGTDKVGPSPNDYRNQFLSVPV